MPADYSRIHRLLKILTLIQGSRGWTAQRLAVECGTTERTIYRDLKMLDGAGIPYFYDPEQKCYSIRRDFFMPPVQLTLDEALAMATLAEHCGGQEQVPFTKAASRAISKIRGLLPAAVRNELDQIESHVEVKLAAANPPEGAADVYEGVREALSQRRAIRCEYESLSGEAGKNGAFLFRPYALLFNQRAWYTIGHHSGRRSVRCLKLTRFTKVEPTKDSYEIPKDFTVSGHLGNAWRMIRGEKSYEIELTFDKEFAETIADTHWHATQDVVWHDDGSITFTAKVDGLDEIVWWILSMGPHCRVLSPSELAGRVKSLAGEILKLYPE
jgi:proteasome accessory factor B